MDKFNQYKKDFNIFRINDIVRINSDLEYVKSVQKGHGEFHETMQSVIFYIFWFGFF